MKKFGLAMLAGAMALSGVGMASAEDTIKIGHLAALTGDWAAYGQTEANASQLAVEEINANGGVLGKKLEIVVSDFKSRPEDAVNAVRRLIDEDKVVAIIGANGSGVNIACAPLVTEKGISQIGTLSTNPLVTVDDKGAVRPYTFRICFTDPYQGKLIAYFAAKELGKKKGAILYDVASDYSQGLREFFLKDYPAYGGEVVADLGFNAGDVDFRAQLTKIKESGAEVLALPNMGKELALIMKQAREDLGMTDIVFVGGDGYGEFMWDIAGDSMENSYWVSHVAPEDEAMAPFFAAYKAKYNDECKEFMNGVMAYDSVYWLKDAIERAGDADPKKIRDAIEATKDLKLHHAIITLDEQHNPKDKDGVMLIAKDGKGQLYKKIKPE